MCFYRDGDQQSPAETGAPSEPPDSVTGPCDLWKVNQGWSTAGLLENREQMRSNTLLLRGDAALAGCSGIHCRFLPLIQPLQFSFAWFLFLLILNLHTWLYGVLLVESPTKNISPPPSSKTYNPSLLCEAVYPQQEHWRFNFHKRLSCLLHHLNFLVVWSWNLCRFFPLFVLSISLKKGAVKHQQQRI